MADSDDKERAEKIAAAKKRYEQKYKKQNKAKGNAKKSDDKSEVQEKVPEEAASSTTQDREAMDEWSKNETVPEGEAEHISEKKAELAPERQADTVVNNGEMPSPSQLNESFRTPSKPPHDRQPSLSLQSKMRSSSFRSDSVSQGLNSPTATTAKSLSLPPLSPDSESVNEIYRKQALRVDELEKENQRLSKEANEVKLRWRKTEGEVEELRERIGEVAEFKSRAGRADAMGEEAEKLRADIAALQRQNSYLQSQQSRPRHSSSPSQINIPTDLRAQLESKASTIENMEIEISSLRARLEKISSTSESHSEQVSALEGKLERAERAAGNAQRELLDVKKNLDRASERAVKEGSERTSAETKTRTLEREVKESRKITDDSMKRVDILEKKLAALTTLHKEADARRRDGEREREKVERETVEMRRRLAALENDNLRLREEKERSSRRDATGLDDEGLDELENEERGRLARTIRELETEVSELRRGIWRQRRQTLETANGEEALGSPGSKFDDIDLGAGPSPRAKPGPSFSNVLSSGFNAFTSGGGRVSLDLMDDDGPGFDEDAFRLAQEEEGRKRLERVKEVKKGLMEWKGWRLDIVDLRLGGGGAGEIFDV